jgi:hypothetical protein
VDHQLITGSPLGGSADKHSGAAEAAEANVNEIEVRLALGCACAPDTDVTAPTAILNRS